jgi:hypothetical protein
VTGTQWGNQLGVVVAQSPTVEELLVQLERQPLLLRGAQDRPLLPLKRQRLLRRKKRRLPRRDWSTSLVSSAPQPWRWSGRACKC